MVGCGMHVQAGHGAGSCMAASSARQASSIVQGGIPTLTCQSSVTRRLGPLRSAGRGRGASRRLAVWDCRPAPLKTRLPTVPSRPSLTSVHHGGCPAVQIAHACGGLKCHLYAAPPGQLAGRLLFEPPLPQHAV